MQIDLAEKYRDTLLGREGEAILRDCVQCAYCNPTCPTYRLLNDEWDGPRGRIHLIKQMLEGNEPSSNLQVHLDRCLTCQSCETTCPQGVRYSRLLEIGRELVENECMERPLRERLARLALRSVLPYRFRFTALLRIGQAMRRVMPDFLGSRIPPIRSAGHWPDKTHTRTMLVWQGCVQPALAPDINAAAARVLDRFGIRLISANTGCCGALSHHMSDTEAALEFMRKNIDACWPQIEAGAEAMVMTASGCGAHVLEYGYLLRDDPKYRDKAKRFSEMTKDIAEIVTQEWADGALPTTSAVVPQRIVFQSPCSLQHGQKLSGVVEKLLKRAGFKLAPVNYPFMCCGSAGSYSILQPAIAEGLREEKLRALLSTRPTMIATANIGCLMHLAAASPVPVRHWIELLDEKLACFDTPCAETVIAQ